MCYPVAKHLGENVGLDSWVSNGCDFDTQDFMSNLLLTVSLGVFPLNVTVMVKKI